MCIIFTETEEKIIELINSYTDSELFQQGGRKWSSSYKGYSDVGYFLGRKFLRFLLDRYSLTEMLCMEMDLMLKD